MKVTMLLSRFDKTGMTTHTIDLLEALGRKGVETSLIVGYRAGADAVSDRLYERAVRSGSRIVTVPVADRTSVWRKLASAVAMIVNVLKIGG